MPRFLEDYVNTTHMSLDLVLCKLFALIDFNNVKCVAWILLNPLPSFTAKCLHK